jgi:hypothetical protein
VTGTAVGEGGGEETADAVADGVWAFFVADGVGSALVVSDGGALSVVEGEAAEETAVVSRAGPSGLDSAPGAPRPTTTTTTAATATRATRPNTMLTRPPC